jgi:Ca2+-binding RTX toxin-like protein
MSAKSISKSGWTFPSAGLEQNALWSNPAAVGLPPGYTVKNGTGGNDVLEGTDQGAEGIDGRGGNDTIYGRGGFDFIIGGLGNDRITLGADLDAVYFNAKLNAKTNVDRIMDFKPGEDQIGLAKFIFKKVGSGNVLKNAAFWTGTKAHDKDDRIIYDKKTGSLYYDPDGNGPEAQTKFAILNNKVALTYKDIWIG